MNNLVVVCMSNDVGLGQTRRATTIGVAGATPELPGLFLPDALARLHDAGIDAHFRHSLRQSVTIVNIGAAYRDDDPVYALNLTRSFPRAESAAVRILGYECDSAAAARLRQIRADVEVVEMCVSGATLPADLHTRGVRKHFAALKIDIDSVDAPVLDAMLRHFEPLVVHVESVWDLPPPIAFGLLKLAPRGPQAGSFNGCWGMSIALADVLFSRSGYRIVGGTSHDLLAVHLRVADVFRDRPSDVFFWYEFFIDAKRFSHWSGGDREYRASHLAPRLPILKSPQLLLGPQLGLYRPSSGEPASWLPGRKPAITPRSGSREKQVAEGGNTEGALPAGSSPDANLSLTLTARERQVTVPRPTASPSLVRSIDTTMRALAQRIQAECRGNQWLLAVGDRCCTAQWNVTADCLCDLDGF
jgi:hypothetical protein